jgi:hypothetical protein
MRVRAALLVVSAILGAGCSDTLFYGESTEFNLAIHVNDNPQQPLEVNMGLKRHVGQVTPPVATAQNESGTAAVGEAVSTLSGFRLRYEENTANVLLGDLYIRTQFATGGAAAELAKNPIQAVKVMDAEFERDADFVSEASRRQRGEIVAGIRALEDAELTRLACEPPLSNATLIAEKDLKDPGCAKRADPAYARRYLIKYAYLDDRTEAAFAKWRSALQLE